MIRKWYSEAIKQRRTNNTTAKRKETKGQETINKIFHRKQKIEQHWKPEWTRALRNC